MESLMVRPCRMRRKKTPLTTTILVIFEE